MREILLTAIQNTTIGGEKLKNSSRGFRIYFIVIALMIIGMYAFSTFSTKDSDYKYNDFITDLRLEMYQKLQSDKIMRCHQEVLLLFYQRINQEK